MKNFSLSALASVAGVTTLLKALQGLVGGLKGIASESLNSYSHFESLQKGLETFYQSADLGKEKFEELRKMSNETTFGVDDLTSAFTQLANVGADLETINDKLFMLGDMAGGSKEKFADLTSVYSKIISTGKAGSEQLQQIATRGIPIYDMLKKLGVQGTATAEDITNAFKEMTKEGGQFYNAMNNINDTIEGKEGFISDFWREMNANLAEASGLADMYKSSLDLVKGVLENVSNWLLQINSNPVAKALFQGALYASITAIATALLSMMIPALLKVVKHLVTINALSGPKGWAVLAVAGITALSTATTGYINEQKKLEEQTRKTAEEHQKLFNSHPESNQTYGEQAEQAKKDVETYKKLADKWTAEVTKISQEKEDYRKKILSYINGNAELEGQYKGWEKSFDEQIEKAQRNADLSNKLWGDNQEIVDNYNALDNVTKKYTELNGVLTSVSDNMKGNYSDIEKQIKQLQELLLLDDTEKLNADGTRSLIDLSQSKSDIDEAIEYLKKKLIEAKIANGEIVSWQDLFYNTTGVQVKNGDGASAGATYKTQTLGSVDNAINALSKIEETLGTSQTDNKKNVYSNAKQQIEEQLSTLFGSANLKIEDAFKSSDKTIKAMGETWKQLDVEEQKLIKAKEEEAQKTKSFSDALNEYIQSLKESDNPMDMVAGYASEALMSYSQDLQNFVNGLQGGIWGGVISAVVGAIASVASECEGFEEAMNPITTWITELKPIIQIITNASGNFVKVIGQVFNAISEVFGGLMPIFEFIMEILNVIRVPLLVISIVLKMLAPLLKILCTAIVELINVITFGLVDKANDFADDLQGIYDGLESTVEETTDAISNSTQDLINQYSSLLDAMKEQEEWYLENKRALNAESRVNSLTSVNDMILTPNGQFSTHPDDYIIATKNPSSLGGATVNFTVNNNASDVVKVNTQRVTSEDGTENFILQISRAIASDVANGSNGWDSAMEQRSVRLAGRRVSL